jgi:hypothetical protein
MPDPVSPKPTLSIENGVNVSATSKIGKSIDVKTTSVNGLLKSLAEQYYQEDTLEGASFFEGQIYRIENPGQSDPDEGYLQRFLKSLVGDNFIRCKVRVPSVHLHLPIPSTFDENEVDKKIIDLYDDFIYQPSSLNNESFTVGDIVKVSFKNLVTYQDGFILNKLSSSPQGQGSVSPTPTNPLAPTAVPAPPASSAFAGKPSKDFNPRIVSPNIPFKELPLLYPRDPSNQFFKRIDPRMFEPITKFITTARAAGHNIIITNGLRTLEEQAEIYSWGRTKLTDDKGKKLGIATQARAGESPHNFGCAIDFAFVKLVDSKDKKTGQAIKAGIIDWKVKSDQWAAAANFAKQTGLLEWGGDWANFYDAPHVELKGWRDTKKQWIATGKGILAYNPPV